MEGKTYLEHVDQNHGVGDIAIQLHLLSSVREVDESPSNYPRSTIKEELEVKPLPYSRVELNSHHVIIENISGKFAAENIDKKMSVS